MRAVGMRPAQQRSSIGFCELFHKYPEHLQVCGAHTPHTPQLTVRPTKLAPHRTPTMLSLCTHLYVHHLGERHLVTLLAAPREDLRRSGRGAAGVRSRCMRAVSDAQPHVERTAKAARSRERAMPPLHGSTKSTEIRHWTAARPSDRQLHSLPPSLPLPSPTPHPARPTQPPNSTHETEERNGTNLRRHSTHLGLHLLKVRVRQVCDHHAQRAQHAQRAAA